MANHLFFSGLRQSVIAGLLFLSIHATASVTMLSTRVIFNEKDNAVPVTLFNTGQTPSILQLWVDKTEKNTPSSLPSAPFLITPHLFKIEPNSQQIIRVLFTKEALPKDRESLFWLNFHQIPATDPNNNNSAGIQFSILNKVKLFYRPEKIISHISDLPNQLTFSLKSNAALNNVLVINNPTGYYANFSGDSIKIGKETIKLKDKTMLAPFSSIELPINSRHAATKQTVTFSLINDHGGVIIKQKNIS